MGLKLRIVPDANSILQIVPSVETYTGVADFNNNAVTIISTESGGSDDFRIGAIFKWKMWLDTDTGFSNDLFIFDNSSGGVTGHLQGWFFDSSLYLGIVGIAYNMYDISGLDNQILDCQLISSYDSYPYPHEFKINDAIQNGTNVAPSGHTDHSGVYVGEAITSVYGVTLDDLDNGTVWDIQTETSLGVPTHAWAGYPAGDTIGAWVDTVGTLDATLAGPTSTRDIVGVNPGSGPVTGSVLLIAPPDAPVPGAPTLYRPLDTSTLGTADPSLAWLSVSGADTYWVQLDNDPGFGSLTYDVSGLAGLYYDVSALDTSTAYYWRAAATNTSGTGSWSSEWEFYTPQAEPSAMLYIATNALASPFDPVFTTSAGTLEWDMDDGSIINANSFSHTYTAGGTKIIKVEPGTASGPEAITEINMVSDNLVGLLDLTPLINLGGDFEINGNSSLTTILMPNSSQVFTKFIGWFTSGITYVDASGLTGLGGELNFFACSNLQTILLPASSELFSQIQLASCDLTGTLDCSGLTGWTPELYADLNYNLTSIIFPESSTVMTDMQISQNDLTGVLDLSGLTGFGGAVQFSYNSNLTGILLPDSSQAFITFEAYWCDLTGTFDMTPLSGFGDPAGGVIDVNTNPNLTQLLLPSSSRIVQSIYAYDCSLAGTLDVSGLTNWYSILDVERNSNLLEILLPSTPMDAIEFINARDCSLSLTSVDNIFSYCDTWFSSNTPVTSLTLNTDGGGSAAPTDGSSNTNIQSLVSIFSGAGQTFTYNIN